jgi:hypothetical protein
MLVAKAAMSADETEGSEMPKGPAEKAKIVKGDRVMRGPDWRWDNQDGGAGKLGRVLSIDRIAGDEWASVEWDAGKKQYRYRVSPKRDLRVVREFGAGVVRGGIAVGRRVARGKDWKWGDQDGGAGKLGRVKVVQADGWASVKWDNGRSNNYRYAGGRDLRVVPEVGDIVERGEDWKWDDQDGGAGKRGRVMEAVTDNGWVRVKWDGSERTNLYRALTHSDLKIVGGDGDAETVAEPCVGMRVMRGKDWKWADQDGGEGGLGTVVGRAPLGWTRVRWESGECQAYRVFVDGKIDLRAVLDLP